MRSVIYFILQLGLEVTNYEGYMHSRSKLLVPLHLGTKESS